jgi:hypothetical protein
LSIVIIVGERGERENIHRAATFIWERVSKEGAWPKEALETMLSI